jgi:hypothetical protein
MVASREIIVSISLVSVLGPSSTACKFLHASMVLDNGLRAPTSGQSLRAVPISSLAIELLGDFWACWEALPQPLQAIGILKGLQLFLGSF